MVTATEDQFYAVKSLAQKMYDYGQFERTLKLLDLADWLLPKNTASRDLRLCALAELGQWQTVVDILVDVKDIEPFHRRLMAKGCWAKGLSDVGDRHFSLAVDESLTSPPRLPHS